MGMDSPDEKCLILPENYLDIIWKQLQNSINVSYPLMQTSPNFQILDIVQNITLLAFSGLKKTEITMFQFLEEMELYFNPEPVVSHVNSFDLVCIDVALIKKVYEKQTRTIPVKQKHLHFVAACNAFIIALHSKNDFPASEDALMVQCSGFCCELSSRFLTDIAVDIGMLRLSDVQTICNWKLPRSESSSPETNNRDVEEESNTVDSLLEEAEIKSILAENNIPSKKKRTISWKVLKDESLLDSILLESIDLNSNETREKRTRRLTKRALQQNNQIVSHTRVRKYLIRKEKELLENE